MADDGPASAVYRIDEEEAPRRERLTRLFVTLSAAVLADLGPTNTGGTRLHIVETATGSTVATWKEQSFDEARTRVHQMRTDLVQLSAAEFADRWVIGDAE